MKKDGLPKSPRLSNTLVPMKAGHLNFNAFIIAFNSDTTAPGLVTKSFKLVGVKNFLAAPAIPPPLPVSEVLIPPGRRAWASAATANSSGARLPVNLVGNCVISFCKKLGR